MHVRMLLPAALLYLDLYGKQLISEGTFVAQL